MRKPVLAVLTATVTFGFLIAGAPAWAKYGKRITLTQIGTFNHGMEYDEGQAEIVAYDAGSRRLFVINAFDKTVDILDMADPKAPTLVKKIDVATDLEPLPVGGVNSVAAHKGLIAVAVENDDQQANGWAALYDVYGNFIKDVEVGALPDAITIARDGKYVLTANEGQPNDEYTVDPEGSVSVIDISNGAGNATVRTADFSYFNGNAPKGVRITGPTGTTVAQDLEPEYIATSKDSKTAWVTLQENNALAIIDIRAAKVKKLVGLGLKDHSLWRNSLDASNEDGAINIRTWPVFGTYMPDSISAYSVRGRTYLVTANEGDSREYGDYTDEARVKDVTLDEAVFPNWKELQEDKNLGRLKMLTTEGKSDSGDTYKEIHIFGGRSITIWDAHGRFLADSGNTIEKKTAKLLPDYFNSDNGENDSFDDRSDDKGPEPEGVVVGKVDDRHYAFVGLERIGGIMVFDVTNPRRIRYVDYVNNRDFGVGDVQGAIEAGENIGDFGPEGLVFIKPKHSPNGRPLLMVGNEVSGTTTIYQIDKRSRKDHDDDDDDDDRGYRRDHDHDHDHDDDDDDDD